MKLKSFILMAVLLLVFFSCDNALKFENPLDENNRSAAEPGELGGECYPNGTCNEGLICDEERNLCIKDQTGNEPTDTGDSSDTTPADTGDTTEPTDTGETENDEEQELPDDNDCPSGYHMESDDDDEDGDGTVSCAPNLTCNPNPCNNQQCKLTGSTVECFCSSASHLTGRWCERCEDGYIKSNVDGWCKPDCSLTTCTAPQKCGIDYDTNEAGCNECEEYYSGAYCRTCDVDHFCNGHATSCTLSGGTEQCICETGYDGQACDDCAEGYVPGNGRCIKDCDTNKCFKTHECSDIFTFSISSHGTCSSTTGECECDEGWFTKVSDSGRGTTLTCGWIFSMETLENVECTICDKNNPPAEHSEKGCPQDLTEDTSLCSSSDSSFCGVGGICYYEPTGSHRLYCECNEHYTLQGSSYSGYCEADQQTANCTGLPSNAQWNTATSITQTWNGSSWTPSATGSYSTTASTEECRFKCKSGYDWDGSSMCVKNGDTRSKNCTGLPSNAQWNTAASITQTWNGSSWTPSTTGSYSTTASTEECRFKCKSGYDWNGSQCVQQAVAASL